MKSLPPFRHLIPLLALAGHHAFAVNVVNLRCDGQIAPLGSTATPALTWRIATEERNQRQSAWQVLVASSAELLSSDKGDLWDSGKTTATRSPEVRYAGKPLVAGTVCHWKVRCWDATDKASAWSEPSMFEVAPTKPADWQGARWIDDGKPLPQRDEDFYQEDPAPLLRREFKINKPVLRARLHVAGLGYAYPSVNGARVADHALDPPWTNFDKRILYRTHDVTKQLSQGTNCLGLTLGNGWYNPLPLRMWGGRNIREALPTGRPRGIALLVVDHPDGTKTTVTTGDGWTTAAGPTLRNSIYLGEERDARKALPGWDKPGFKSTKWKPARVADAPLEPLQPLAMPPVRALDPVKAVAVTTPSAGIHIVDFGLNLTAIPEIKLDVPAGTRVLLRFGEILHEDGTLNPMTSVCGQIKGMRKDKEGKEFPIGGPGSPQVAWQQDVYIARGGGEVYRPDFTFHSFRYMEVSGVPAAPKTADCVVFPMHTQLASAGSFSCSNDRLNRIQEITRRTFLNNVVTVQSDCPHRERFGYGGDIVATSEAFLMNYDMSGFYAKTVRDWADGARPDGNFTDTAPFVGIQYCGVGWAMVHPLLIEQLYQHYGNKTLIEEQLPAAIRWFDLEASKREKDLVINGLGDHESMPRKAGPAITTPMFIDTANRMARLSRIAGNEKDAERFQLMAAASASAWSQAFMNKEVNGKVEDGSQSSQTIGLGFGAVPADARPAVFSRLVGSLTEPDDGPRLTTGIFGTRLLLEELSKNNRSDLAYALADRKEFPSWGHMLENGATTLWETWKESDNTFSHNHPMFGSISAWFFRWLGGIQPADDAVGFDRMVIRPQVVAGLNWVKSSHDTIRGSVTSNWTKDNGTVRFDIVIPPDTTARIELPAGAADTVTEGGKTVDAGSGIKELPKQAGLRSFEVGSGTYSFEVRPAR